MSKRMQSAQNANPVFHNCSTSSEVCTGIPRASRKTIQPVHLTAKLMSLNDFTDQSAILWLTSWFLIFTWWSNKLRWDSSSNKLGTTGLRFYTHLVGFCVLAELFNANLKLSLLTLPQQRLLFLRRRRRLGAQTAHAVGHDEPLPLYSSCTVWSCETLILCNSCAVIRSTWEHWRLIVPDRYVSFVSLSTWEVWWHCCPTYKVKMLECLSGYFFVKCHLSQAVNVLTNS